MGYSMRLEFARVCSLNDFQLVMGLYRGRPLFLFFLEYVYLSLLNPSLIFDMFLSLCVCVCGVVLGFTNGNFSSV